LRLLVSPDLLRSVRQQLLQAEVLPPGLARSNLCAALLQEQLLQQRLRLQWLRRRGLCGRRLCGSSGLRLRHRLQQRLQ
jgi:hypothetical protein